MGTKSKKSKKQTKATEEQAKDTPEQATDQPKAKKAKKAKTPKPKKVSALDAAAKVLGETGEPMNCPKLIETMAAKGYWKSPNGQTPHATLYAAILREITTKGKESRFKKTDRGMFALNQ